MSEAETEAIGGNLGDLVSLLRKLPEIMDQLKELRQLVPIVLDIIDCVKSMAPETRERVGRIVSRLASDSDEAAKIIEAFRA